MQTPGITHASKPKQQILISGDKENGDFADASTEGYGVKAFGEGWQS